MKDIKIVSGEPVKAKVLGYSQTNLNKVVALYTFLYKVNDHVYLAEHEKNKFNHSEDDLFAFVLKVKNVFVRSDILSRKSIENTPGIVEMANEAAVNYIDNIKSRVGEKKHVLLLHIKVFEALGFDTKPLWDARHEFERLKQEKKGFEEEQRKERQIESRQKEKERLEGAKQNFLNNEYIDVRDFLSLCKNDGIEIHIRTKGTFNNYVNQVNIDRAIRYSCKKGKKPNLSGCFDAIGRYKDFLTKNIP